MRDALALARAVARPGTSPPAPNPTAARAAAAPARGAGATRDPARVFEELLADTAFIGALVLDVQGLVIVGTLAMGGRHRVDRLGAVLGEAVEEAARMAGFLGLGAWRGILLHTDAALLHVTPLGGGSTLVVAAAPDAPTGWMLRTSARAAELARAYVGEAHD